MTLTRLFPPGAPISDSTPEGADVTAVMAPLYAPPAGPWVRINLIASVNGSATGSDGTSNTLTSRTDRAVLKLIRSTSDVVVVGAATVRAEGFRMPQDARLAVITSTGELGGHRLATPAGTEPLLVLCPRAAVAAARRSVADVPIDIIVLPDDDGRIDLADAIDAFGARSLRRVLCEGGPRLAAQFIDFGLVDELCLTVAPVIAGGRRVFDGIRGGHSLTMTQLLVDDAGFQFFRWAISSRAVGAPRSIP